MEANRGMQGIAAIVHPERLVKQTADNLNDLLLLNAGPDNNFDYWAGCAWDQAGKVSSADDWKKYVDEFAQGVQSPIETSISMNK